MHNILQQGPQVHDSSPSKLGAGFWTGQPSQTTVDDD